MAGSIKGIIVEIGGDTLGLQNALKNANKAVASLSKELKGINSLLKLDPNNTILLTQKQNVLTESIKETTQSLESLKKMQDEYVSSGKDLNTENYRYIQREIINTENKLKQLKLEASDWTIQGRKLEEYGTKIENIGEKFSNLGNKLTTVVSAPIIGLTAAGIKYNAEIERYTSAFTTFIGDAKEAEKVVNSIKANAAKTPFDVASLIQANQALISTGENAENAQETILALGDAITATGGGNAELVRMAVNLQQVKNAGKATALDIKQFAYAGIDIYGLLANYTGKTVEQVKEMDVTYEVLTNALKKSNKEGGKYFNAMTNSSKTLNGQLNMLKSDSKQLIANLTQSLLPTAKKLIDSANTLIKNFDKLSDSEKENIVKIGLMVAAAGPLIKILGSTTTAVGSTIKAVGTFSQAIGVMNTGAKSSSEAVNSLASKLTGLTSGYGLAALAVGTLVAAWGVGVAQTKERQKYMQDEIDAINDEISAREELTKAVFEQENATISQMDNVSKLTSELELLVDENGKVKKGYEDRVGFILNELNGALGTEYKMTGNIIENYNSLRTSVDELIKTKKANAILEAEEALYNEAINQKADAYTKLSTAQKNVYAIQNKISEWEQKYGETPNTFMEKLKAGFKVTTKAHTELNNLQSDLQKAQEELSGAEKNYKQIMDNINTYTSDATILLGDDIEAQKKLLQDKTHAHKTASDDIAESTNLTIANYLYDLEMLKKYKDEAVKKQDQAATEYFNIQIETNKKSLEEQAKYLASMVSATEEMSPYQIKAWKNLADNSLDTYINVLSGLPEETKNKIQEATGVVVGDTSVESAMGDLAEKANSGFNNNIDGTKWGNDLAQNISNGMNSKSSQSAVTRAASKLASIISSYVHFSVPDKGPLSDFDKSMPDMINLMTQGIENNKGKLLNSAYNLASQLNSTLNSQNLITGDIGNINGISSKVINGSNTIFTTPQIVFNVQELDKNKLEQCFEYVNMKFGSQY